MGLRELGCEPGGEVVNDARGVGHAFGHHGIQLLAIIGMKAIFVAMLAGPVAKPCHYVIDRFHSCD